MCNALHENAHETGSNPIVMASNLLEMAFKLIDKTKEAKGPSLASFKGGVMILKGTGMPVSVCCISLFLSETIEVLSTYWCHCHS